MTYVIMSVYVGGFMFFITVFSFSFFFLEQGKSSVNEFLATICAAMLWPVFFCMLIWSFIEIIFDKDSYD